VGRPVWALLPPAWAAAAATKFRVSHDDDAEPISERRDGGERAAPALGTRANQSTETKTARNWRTRLAADLESVRDGMEGGHQPAAAVAFAPLISISYREQTQTRAGTCTHTRHQSVGARTCSRPPNKGG
jgi:hypothetical protein